MNAGIRLLIAQVRELQVSVVAIGAACLCISTMGKAAEFDCVIEPRQTVEIRSPVTGLIERVQADRGQFVKAGQVVVEIDAGEEIASLELARKKSKMEGPLMSSKARLEFASTKLQRRESLVEQHYASHQERDEASTEKQLAEADLLDAQDNRKLAELEVRRGEEQLRLRRLKSPVGGVVTERNLQPGELAEPGETKKPILRIAEITTLNVEAVLPAEAYTMVKNGQQATVRAEVPMKFSTSGTVKVVDRVLDAASGTFGVRLEVTNSDMKIPAGIHCFVEFAQIPADLGRSKRSGATKPR